MLTMLAMAVERPGTLMLLPYAENAEVDIRKLIEYCLNADHPEGKHKARVFAAALGMTVRDAEALRLLLLQRSE